MKTATHQLRKAVLGGVTKKVALLMLSAVFLLTSGAAAVFGQSALDGFDPDANGIIQVVVVQPDGKILIGGDFTIVQGISRNRIARLNADGTLDQLFDPNANGYVNAIALQADGKILVGGSFSGLNSIGGQTRNYMARLDGTTGQADSFNPNANSSPYTIAVQADGKILVGGSFTSIGGTNRNRMARLDATTGQADSFNPAVSGLAVNTIVVQPDGRILVGGTFGGIGGQPRNHIARLDAVTGLADSFSPNASAGFYVVSTIALQADGKVLAGGTFANIGGQPRNSIARLDATTGLADSFNPNANNIVRFIAVQPDGKILAGGDFSNIGGTNRNCIARLDAITGLAESFDPNANGGVNSIAVQEDGKILAGGYFSTITPSGGTVTTRNRIARLETDGRLDRTLNLSILGLANNVVYATALQPDGKILIGGTFTNVLGVRRHSIARLNTDGTLDTVFTNVVVSGGILAIAVQADGKILIGGGFSEIGGVLRKNIARLNANGTLDFSFNPDVNLGVGVIAVQPDGRILVGGDFTNVGGQARNRIARLGPDGGIDPLFNPNANAFVNSIVVQSDGKILAGGGFTNIGGQARNYIVRLDATNGLADSFNPNANDAITAIAVQPDGKILVSGGFNGTNSIGGQSRNHIARLNTNGTADSFDPNATDFAWSIAVQTDGKVWVGGQFRGTNSVGGQTRNYIARLDASTGSPDSFNPDASGGNGFPPSTVYSIALQADGKILVGGKFANIGGQARNFFARLSNDAAAMQNLAVSQTTITWTRGGSSPQFTRATFESSTDNVNYTLLGSGTVAGSNWTLTGLNLSTGQNLYIRARGYFHGGQVNGSEGLTESVRNVFLPSLPPRLNIQRQASTNVVLSWAAEPAGFTLETKTNLNTNVWSSVSPAPVISGTNNVVTNAVSGAARFYRLRQ